MHRHTYLDIDTLTHAHTHIATTIALCLNSLTHSIWFRLSQEERHGDIQGERVSVSEGEKRPLCLCLDLHYHVLILMQFEKETDMETHWVKRGLSVLSGTACSQSIHASNPQLSCKTAPPETGPLHTLSLSHKVQSVINIRSMSLALELHLIYNVMEHNAF